MIREVRLDQSIEMRRCRDAPETSTAHEPFTSGSVEVTIEQRRKHILQAPHDLVRIGESLPAYDVVDMTVFVSDCVEAHLATGAKVVRDAYEERLNLTLKSRGILFRALVIPLRLFRIGRLIPLLSTRIPALVIRSSIPIRVDREVNDHDREYYPKTADFRPRLQAARQG